MPLCCRSIHRSWPHFSIRCQFNAIISWVMAAQTIMLRFQDKKRTARSGLRGMRLHALAITSALVFVVYLTCAMSLLLGQTADSASAAGVGVALHKAARELHEPQRAFESWRKGRRLLKRPTTAEHMSGMPSAAVSQTLQQQWQDFWVSELPAGRAQATSRCLCPCWLL